MGSTEQQGAAGPAQATQEQKDSAQPQEQQQAKRQQVRPRPPPLSPAPALLCPTNLRHWWPTPARACLPPHPAGHASPNPASRS